MARDISLVLVTGAGASTAFGVERPLPLMAQWSDLLVSRLLESGADVHGLSGLRPKMAGPDFEAALGLFLRRAEAFARIKDIIPMTLNVSGGPGPAIQTWYDEVQFRFDQINQGIVDSLIREFNHSRLAVDAAANAYNSLFQTLRITSFRQLVYATTNFDSLGELALAQLGAHIDAGEPTRQPGGHATGLDVAGLLDGMPRTTPVLHLHGKAGWYRNSDGLVEVLDVTQHHQSHGVPVVMLPDPNKTFAGDDVLALLWAQLEDALSNARRVLVLGHSLNDVQLVKMLKERIPNQRQLAITYFGDESTHDEEQLAQLKSTFGTDPSYYAISFGRKLAGRLDLLAQWATS
jgi:SIR2-like protein